VQSKQPPLQSAELSFLLASLGRAVHPKSATNSNPPSDLDWNRLLLMAHQHRLSLLLAWVWDDDEMIPAGVRGALASSFTQTASGTLQKSADLLRLLTALQAAGVAALAYKGPPLAARLYDNPAIRPSADIDLLVRPSDLGKAREVLSRHGYSPMVPLTAEQESWWLASECSLDFVRQGTRVAADLHWTIVPRHYAIDMSFESLWERRRLIPFGEAQIATLSAEDCLLTLAIHGGKHLWERLIWVCDISRLLEVEVIDWQCLESRATQLGVRRLLWIALRLARDLFGGELPAPVAEHIERDGAAGSLAASLAAGYDRPSASSDLARWRLQLEMRERRRDRARCVYRYATTAGVVEWNWVHLPRAASPLYPLVRMARLGLSAIGVNPPMVPRRSAQESGA